MKLNKSMRLLAMMGLIAFLFSSCEKEEIHQQNNQKNSISFEEFKNEVQQNKFDHYLLIPSKRINNLAKNKTIDEFIIDTTFVKKHINSFDKNISTYSLKIYPKGFTKSPSIFYNLVYYKSGEQWNYRIIEITRSTHKSKKYESILTLYNSGVDINSTTSRICTSEATYYHCTGCTDVCDECGLCVTVQTNVESCPDTPAEFTVVDGDGGNNFQTGNTGAGSGDSNFDYFIFYNDLNQQQKDWIANNQDSFNDIVNYLNQNNYSAESKDFINQLINIAIVNSDYKNIEISVSPNFKMKIEDQLKYPRFTNMVKNLEKFVNDNPIVLEALIKNTGLTKEKVLEGIKWGKGPLIRIEDIDSEYGKYNSYEKVLRINAKYVRGLEIATMNSTQKNTSFLLAITVLHEYTHYGDHIADGAHSYYEVGWGFEQDILGQARLSVEKTNAHIYIKMFKF